MLKQFYFLILVILSNTNCLSQARDYFMPKTLSTTRTYYLFAPDGQRTNIKRLIEYNYINNKYVINEINGTDEAAMSVAVLFVEFTQDKVLITYSDKKNALGGKSNKQFNPPAILLKLPKGNETVSWKNNETGENYTARFVILNEDGENKKFLATYMRSGNIIEAKYYYPGVGLWKTAMIKDGVSTTMYKLIY